MENSNTESGNINPKTKWDYFKSAPRILFMFMCVYLIYYVTTTDVDEYKIKTIAWLCFGLFVARGTEKGLDMWTARK